MNYLKLLPILAATFALITGGCGDNKQSANESPVVTSPPTATTAPPPAPKKELTGSSYMSKSKKAIEEKGKVYVTDSWMTEYSETLYKDGKVVAQGFVEINSDGVKRPFWCTFNFDDDTILRVKVGDVLVYSVDGK